METVERNAAIAKAIVHLDRQIRWAIIGALLLGVAGVIILTWGLFQFDPSPEGLSALGSFLAGTVGPLWSAAGLVLIYVAFLGQRRQILHQEEAIDLERMELRDTQEQVRATEMARRAAVEFRIGALAYSTYRQLSEWARDLYGDRDDILGDIQFWGEMGDESSNATTARTYTGIVQPIMEKWRRSKSSQDTVEKALLDLQTLAPDASPAKRDAVQMALVRFYDFAGRLNRQLARSDDGTQPEWKELVLGLRALGNAVKALEGSIDAELLSLARAEAVLPPSLLEQFASTLEAELRKEPDNPSSDN